MICSLHQQLSISACESISWSVYELDNLCLPSTCESCVAIIVSSTPAFASFFKDKMPGAFWQASMGPFVRRFRHRASTSNTELLHASNRGLSPFGGVTVPRVHTRDKASLESHDIRHCGDSDAESMGKEIWEEGAGPRTLEESVVLKPVANHQSKGQEQTVVDGWDDEPSGVKELPFNP